MFKKVLVANRGEIAVRVIRACRDLGIETVALYEMPDIGSLHVRLADSCVQLTSDLGYMDQAAILQIAKDAGVDAIHPGYGFLAEEASFIRACESAGIVFIGPPADVVATLKDKIGAQRQVREAGNATPIHSAHSFGRDQIDALRAEADSLGYPVIVKSCSGGRGRGTRLIRSPEQLEDVIHTSYAAARAVFGNDQLYLERAILPSRYVEVQILADQYGNIIHLGERDASIQRNSQKVIAETPAPYMTPDQRERLWHMAADIARMFGCSNACTIEFLMDANGDFFFTEIKARVQMEHPGTEMVSLVDIVREQIRIAASEPLSVRQDDVQLRGCAMQCRINAEDPWNHFMPSPGELRQFRLPGGPHVRVDTYVYNGCDVPVRYDPVFAKLTVWGENRDECLQRMRRALEDFIIEGIQTNLPLIQRIMDMTEFLSGEYNTESSRRSLMKSPAPAHDLRNLAVAAAVAYVSRNQSIGFSMPDRLLSGWHRDSRRLPG